MEKTKEEEVDAPQSGKKQNIIGRIKNLTPDEKKKVMTITGCVAVAFLLLCFVQF